MNYLGNGFFRNGLGFNNGEFNYLRTDIYEQDNVYYLKIEVPGIEKENIRVDYENGYLTVSVKQEDIYEEVNEYIRKERIMSEKERTFYVGDIHEESIKASCQNGVLTITLGKNEERKEEKRQIIIE
ncbi:MAG: Hsp20/alpha crystallin family protein [Bacilli bacterium]|nr:Hsp20/alpha crystallin family protein [Bacilli bacterium]